MVTIIHDLDEAADFVAKQSRMSKMVILVPGMIESDTDDQIHKALFVHAGPDMVQVILHNESNGFLGDLAESIGGKLLGGVAGIRGTCIEYPARVLQYILDRWSGPVMVLAHSQGAILAVNALDAGLPPETHLRTFGGASWGGSVHAKTQVDYCSDYDPVGFLFGRGVRAKSSRVPVSPGGFRFTHDFSFYWGAAVEEIRRFQDGEPMGAMASLFSSARASRVLGSSGSCSSGRIHHWPLHRCTGQTPHRP